MGVAARLALACLLLLALGGDSRAETRIDWEQGLLIATAAAPADLRSPNTQLARVKANRVARQRCYQKLRLAAEKLVTASGASVQKQLGKRLPEMGLGLMLLGSDQGSDGSVVVRMALPLDSLRGRLYGPDSPRSEPLANQPVLLVDARKLSLHPSLGTLLKAGETKYRGPVLFFASEKRARAEARVGAKTPLIVAKSVKHGMLALSGADTPGLLEARPLVVIIYKESK